MSEGFANPVSNAIGTLIRKALQSFGFVSGSTGWQIQRNGNAEFNNVIIRGQVIEGVTGGLRVEIGPGAVIKFFNGANVEVGQLDASGFLVGNDLSNLTTATLVGMVLNNALVSGPAIEVQPGASFSGNWNPAVFGTTLQNAGNAFEQESLLIAAPAGHLGYPTAPAIQLVSQAQDGSLPGAINFEADTHVFFNHNATVAFAVVNSNGIFAIKPLSLASAEIWHGVTTGPGYAANWADVGGTTQPARYRLMPDGTVMLSGGAKTTANITGASIVFTLPAGYRPLNDEQFPGNSPAGSRIAIEASTGRVILVDYAGTVSVPTLALSHIRFTTAAIV